MDILSMFGLNKKSNKDLSELSLEDLQKQEKKLSSGLSKLDMATMKLQAQIKAIKEELVKRESNHE